MTSIRAVSTGCATGVGAGCTAEQLLKQSIVTPASAVSDLSSSPRQWPVASADATDEACAMAGLSLDIARDEKKRARATNKV